MDELIILGFLLVFIGFILIFSSIGKVKMAVGGFIGPIPFGWANDPEMLKWIIVFSIIVLLGFLFLFLR